MASTSPSSYRADIDGLRAVAVLSVIVFHIRANLLPGGFVGVDVFFVISGYLITRSIVKDIDEERFSLVGFYERRVKRIFPAMAVVVFVATVAAQVLMLPLDAIAEAKSALWSLISAGNLYFWLFQDNGYFSTDSALAPLLHLWSLGVEEQYYLLYPIILTALYAPTRRLGPLVWGMVLTTIGTFLVGQLLLSGHASFAYYTLPPRAGELLLGALVAFATLRRPQCLDRTATRLAIGWVGIGLLSASLVFLSEESDFPGWNAAIPTLGTAFVIWSGSSGPNVLSRVLSWNLLAWIGLISYSAYLWHWPLLAFYRYGYGEPTMGAGIAIFCLTIVLAWLSYKFVEQPARKSRAAPKVVFVRQLALPMVCVGLVAALTLATGGFGYRAYVGRFPAQYEAMTEDDKAPHKYEHVCQRRLLYIKDLSASHCEVGPRSAKAARVMLWGDSNAAHYVGVLSVFAEAGNFRFFNLEHSACPPLLSDPKEFVVARQVKHCRKSLEILANRLNDFDVIVMAASWSTYQNRSRKFFNALEGTIRTLTSKGKHVILLGKAPTFSNYDRLCGKKALLYPGLHCMGAAEPISTRVLRANRYLEELAAKTPSLDYHDFQSQICFEGVCSPYTADSFPLYFNGSHLGVRGAERIGRDIVEAEGIPQVFKVLVDK